MSQNILNYLVRAIVLFTAMPVHECAHGYVAYRLGDDTARSQGRLTLNPFYHLDPIGSILLLFTGFGWAKPVPVNPRRFKHPRRDMALSSLAGPLSNILLALVVMIIAKLLAGIGILFGMLPVDTSYYIYMMLDYMVLVNLYLAVFNLLPVPPLDGFKIFGAVIPDKYYFTMLQYERYIALIVFVLIATRVLTGPISFLAGLVYRLLNFITSPLNLLL